MVLVHIPVSDNRRKLSISLTPVSKGLKNGTDIVKGNEYRILL